MKKLFGFDIEKQWDYENGFYITSHPSRLAKSIAHYDVYKQSLGLPGEIMECGVYKGASLIRFATYRQMLESDFSRKIIGFDMFGKFPVSGDKNDKEFIEKFECSGGDGISVDELYKVLDYKKIENIELIQGNIIEKIPEYLNKNPQLKISLLHIDVDIYEPTRIILENLYERVVRGGIIVLDDYSTVHGETKAVDEFFRKNNINAEIKKTVYYKIPAYIVKNE